MIVLGVDPGTAITGYGLIEVVGNSYKLLDYGVIRPKPTAKISARRRHIFDGLCQLLDEHKPNALSVETQYVRHNPQTTMKLGMVRGIAILAATLRDIPVFEYAPSKAKLAVSGRGNASKEHVQAMVQRLLSLRSPPKPEDAADALALAICHLHAVQGNLNVGVEI